MDRITINVHRGVLGTEQVSFTSDEGGCAFAVARALQYLISRMQVAIMTDHDRARQGQKPDRSDYGMIA